MKAALVVPVATGMSLTLTFLTLAAKKHEAGLDSSDESSTRDKPKKNYYIIWSRVDQKSCLKSILTANLLPLIVEPVLVNDQLETNVEEMQHLLEEYGSEQILGVFTTTSCFAPRARDDVVQVAKLCREYQVYHVINNAYGIQSSKCCHLISQALVSGEVSVVIQSTDKNFMYVCRCVHPRYFCSLSQHTH